MQLIPLAVAKRTTKNPCAMRREGTVPCVVYGKVENMPLECNEKLLEKAYTTAGESTLVELDMTGTKVPVLFHAVQFDPVSDRIIHADFYAVDMKKEVEAEVPLRLVGEAPAAKELGAIIVTPVLHVTVRALPMDLPHDIAVDISSLIQFHETITVASLKVGKSITVVDAPETVLVVAQEPRAEEVVEVKPAEGEVPVEGVTAEGTEGAPAAEGEVKEKAPSASSGQATKESKEKGVKEKKGKE